MRVRVRIHEARAGQHLVAAEPMIPSCIWIGRTVSAHAQSQYRGVHIPREILERKNDTSVDLLSRDKARCGDVGGPPGSKILLDTALSFAIKDARGWSRRDHTLRQEWMIKTVSRRGTNSDGYPRDQTQAASRSPAAAGKGSVRPSEYVHMVFSGAQSLNTLFGIRGVIHDDIIEPRRPLVAQ